MRVFTILLMMTIAVVGALAGYRAITGKDLLSAERLSAAWPLSLPGASSTPTATATATSTPVPPSPTPTPSATPTPAPTETPVPAGPEVLVVAGTDGQGVYSRRTPKLSDRLRAWVEGTRMQVVERNVEGDGQKWVKVIAPDGSEGYVPEQYLAEAP